MMLWEYNALTTIKMQQLVNDTYYALSPIQLSIDQQKLILTTDQKQQIRNFIKYTKNNMQNTAIKPK
jgi:hypothetical protein